MALRLRRGLAANFEAVTLVSGEPAFLLDTGKLYIGGPSGEKILVNPDQAAAESAAKLTTPRTIALNGDGTGSTSFDGSANVAITLVLANSGATAGTFTKVQIDAKGRVISASQITAADIPNLTLAKITDAGTAASKNTGTAAGQIPILDSGGKLDAAVLPAIAITDTFVVATQAAMLALTCEVGDVAVRTDLQKSFILKTAGASTLANWQELLTPTSPVQSVAGKTGAVTLASADVGLNNVTNESKATMFAGAALTGNSTAITQAAADNSTRIATTAYVKSQNYLTASSDIDGGTF
jgi:hypothetical protein